MGMLFGKLEEQRPLGKHRDKNNNNIKKDLEHVGRTWNGLVWLGEETHGRLL